MERYSTALRTIALSVKIPTSTLLGITSFLEHCCSSGTPLKLANEGKQEVGDPVPRQCSLWTTNKGKPEMRNRGSPRYRVAILQRATYKVGLLTIQGVSTCLYLCMDACGFQYAHNDRARSNVNEFVPVSVPRSPRSCSPRPARVPLTSFHAQVQIQLRTEFLPGSDGRGEHERGERGTDTGTNSFTLLRARSFYRQFLVTKHLPARQICRSGVVGRQRSHYAGPADLPKTGHRTECSHYIGSRKKFRQSSVEFGPARTMDDEIVVLRWYLRQRSHYAGPADLPRRQRSHYAGPADLPKTGHRTECSHYIGSRKKFRQSSVEFGPARTMDDEIVVLWWVGRGEHERGERGTDTGTNSFTLLRARSFYRQFVVTKHLPARQICRSGVVGRQRSHYAGPADLPKTGHRTECSHYIGSRKKFRQSSVEFGPARTMDDEIVVLRWYLNRRQNKRGERGTDTGTNSFTLLRARSFYRQFVVTKRSVEMPGSAKMPDPG
ncbi:unnamed protein product [Plutella xylostella]|uniref:(diamondback moth) hypothetical protein n=1 Tax=Plutella xylostella TaxID=51655 RepID=A0A8S4FVE2_PLUXY|nr:unnamed protein product [Plutella xylostella]